MKVSFACSGAEMHWPDGVRAGHGVSLVNGMHKAMFNECLVPGPAGSSGVGSGWAVPKEPRET